MNQDEAKKALIDLRPPKVDFTLIYSGKESHQVNGLYKPASHEIILHNRNFKSDNALFYTAMHEYAHHIMVTEHGATGSRSHTNAFWATLHELANIAEAKGLYVRPAKVKEVATVNATITDLIRQSGEIMKAIGRALVEAQAACAKNGVRFEDYVQRDLKQTLPWAKACMLAAGYDLPAELGAENMKTAAAIKNDDERDAVVVSLEGELSPQQVKAARTSTKEPEDRVERLKMERERIAHSVEHLLERQRELEREIAHLQEAA